MPGNALILHARFWVVTVQHPPTFHKRTAQVLVLLFAAAWLLRTVHGFILHPGHTHDRLVCTAFYDGRPGKTHLHDKRYAVEDCPVCDFAFAIPELLSVTALLTPPAVLHDSVATILPASERSTLKDTTFRRGPPVL